MQSKSAETLDMVGVDWNSDSVYSAISLSRLTKTRYHSLSDFTGLTGLAA